MGKAVSQVFTEAWHGLCTFHIMQNAVKHLHEEKNEEEKEENRMEKSQEKKRKKKKEEKKEEDEDQVFYQILVHACLSMKTL
jgi:hypothetical protein